MKQKSKRKELSGTSLVELIMYVAIMAMMLLSISSFIVANKKMGDRHRAMTEVNLQGAEAMRIILQSIRNAQSINSPIVSTNDASLSVAVGVSAKNPTVFDLSGGKLRIKEGTGSVIELNSDQVEISNLKFKNMTASNAPGSVRVSFDISYVNPGGRMELNYVKKYVDSASIPQ